MSSNRLAVIFTILAVVSRVTCREKVAPVVLPEGEGTDARVSWGYHRLKSPPVILGTGAFLVQEPMLLCARYDGVHLINLSTSDNHTTGYNTLIKVNTVDYHYRHQLVYYAAFDMILRDQMADRLTRVGLPQPVVSEGVGGPVSLVVDWVNDRLYWMSHRQHTLEVTDLGGSNRTTLLLNLRGSAFPNNLAVDPYRRYLFMVVNGSIYRTDLDGKGLMELPSEGARVLTLDRQGQRVLYSGKRGNYNSGKVFIGSCDYDGLQCKDLSLDGRWNDIFSLDYFRNTLYFAHFTVGNTPDSLWTANTSQDTLKPTLKDTVKGLNTLKVYHSKVQQTYSNENV